VLWVFLNGSSHANGVESNTFPGYECLESCGQNYLHGRDSNYYDSCGGDFIYSWWEAAATRVNAPKIFDKFVYIRNYDFMRLP